MVSVLAAFILAGCGSASGGRFSIISGSENETLAPMIAEYGKKIGVEFDVTYKGSVDIMLELAGGSFAYDAVWPANGLWVSLGDKSRRVKHLASVMTSPVAFGVKQSVAQRLGYVGKDVRVADILGDIRAGQLSFMMTSATQSNSGSSAYMGFLYALAGNPDILTMEHLRSADLRADIRDLLGGINRSSGSSGWLKDLFLSSDYEAMVNYEAVLIETNRELEASGREPLYIVYPIDGTVIADSPLGYYDSGDADKEKTFLKLQEHLLSEPVQKAIAMEGRRTGLAGLDNTFDPRVFRADWGIDPARILTPIRMPQEDVISEALRLYQTDFRKPSYTVYALDYSGSMADKGERQLKDAMALLLDPDRSGVYLLQPGADDRIVVLPFSNRILAVWEADGGDPAALEDLRAKIENLEPGGNTDIYSPALEGLKRIAGSGADRANIASVVLMTDGISNTGKTYQDLRRLWNELDLDVPVFCIMFGDASKEQLDAVAELTRARVFDGREDLVAAFRQVRGYN
jgi:Ca-activated chloride channel family protein